MASESERCVDELLLKTNKIDEQLERLQSNSSPSLLDESRNLLQDTQLFIDNNRSLIPAYILKKISQSLSQLENQVNTSNKSKLIFKFKSKPTASPAVSQITNSPGGGDEKGANQHEFVAQKIHGFQNKTGQYLTLTSDEVECKDISLVGLEKCTVEIIGMANTVYIRNLTDCMVIICLACRAVTVKNCTNCKLELVCQQLRIDSTTDTKFTIFTSARSMLESSRGLTFGQLKLENLSSRASSEQVQELMRRANFDGEQNNWRCIDDFDWLSQDVPSKNYNLLADATGGDH